METLSDRSAVSLPSTHGARPPLEAVSLSSSCGMVNTFAAPLLRAQPVRSPVLPQSARAACPAFSSDVDADVCRWGDGLHSCSCSSEQAYLADVPSAVHKGTLSLPILSEGRSLETLPVVGAGRPPQSRSAGHGERCRSRPGERAPFGILGFGPLELGPWDSGAARPWRGAHANIRALIAFVTRSSTPLFLSKGAER